MRSATDGVGGEDRSNKLMTEQLLLPMRSARASGQPSLVVCNVVLPLCSGDLGKELRPRSGAMRICLDACGDNAAAVVATNGLSCGGTVPTAAGKSTVDGVTHCCGVDGGSWLVASSSLNSLAKDFMSGGRPHPYGAAEPLPPAQSKTKSATHAHTHAHARTHRHRRTHEGETYRQRLMWGPLSPLTLRTQGGGEAGKGERVVCSEGSRRTRHRYIFI